jgi:hypothetical protein
MDRSETYIVAMSKAEKLRALFADHQWHSRDELLALVGHRFSAVIYSVRNGSDGRPPLNIEATSTGLPGRFDSWRLTAPAQSTTSPATAESPVAGLQ